jgi:hypothetical protein
MWLVSNLSKQLSKNRNVAMVTNNYTKPDKITLVSLVEKALD